MNKNDLILVTGANGFVATEIIKQLLESGYKVRGTVRALKDEDKHKHLLQFKDADKNLELIEADLLKESHWPNAVKDCDYVLHVASPFPRVNPNDPDSLIKPAVNGTLNVLKACSESSTVKRVVLTSSVVAIYDASSVLPRQYEEKKVFDENDWTFIDSPNIDLYVKSKTLAEKAAWDFVKNLPEGKKLDLAVINAGLVIGPLYTKIVPTSMDLLKRMLDGSMLAVAKLCLPIADNRNVAQAHIKALTEPEAVGNRHIIVTESLWQKEMALILQKKFKSQGYFIPSTVAPNFTVWIASWWDKPVKTILARLGKYFRYNNRRMIEVLKVNPISSENCLIDAAYSLIEMGIIGKLKKSKEGCTS